nr:zinc finger, CCHC-type [Tanacetum cinerariifolium]
MAVAMKHIASSFAKLEKFEGVDFKRWKKKIHFMLSSMSVVYVLTTPIPENPTVKQVKKRAKWDNDDYVYRGLILNDFKHTLKYLKEELTLIELGSNLCIEESLRVQDSDKPKGNNVIGPSVVNMVEHNNSSRHNDKKGKRKHHDTRANPNKKPKVTCWKCGKPGHLKKDCKASNVGNKANGSNSKGSKDGSSNPLKGQNMFNKSHQIYYVTYVSEAFFVQDDDVAWLNIVFDNIGSAFMSTSKLNNSILWHARLGYVQFKMMQDMSMDGSISAIDIDTEKSQVLSIPRPSQRSLVKGTEDSGGSVVFERVTDGIVQQSEPKLKKRKRHRTPKDFGPEFQLYLIEGTSLIIHQIDVKTAFSNEELEEEDYMNQPLGFIMTGNENKVDLTKEFLSSRFSMKDMGKADVILGIRIKHESNGIAISQSHYIEKVLKKFNYSDCTPVSTPLDTYEKMMPNRGLVVSHLEYSRVIGCLMYAMNCTRPDIAFTVGNQH